MSGLEELKNVAELTSEFNDAFAKEFHRIPELASYTFSEAFSSYTRKENKENARIAKILVNPDDPGRNGISQKELTRMRLKIADVTVHAAQNCMGNTALARHFPNSLMKQSAVEILEENGCAHILEVCKHKLSMG